MPRPPRLLVDDACYHILTRGNNRAPVFFEDADRQRYGQWLLDFSQHHHLQVYHYCLMTNHVHLVVRAAQGSELRRAMQRLNLTYAKYLRRTYGHVGHVWQDRFKSLLIADDAYLLQCGVYIELNPVRARMVAIPAAYRWSSYRVYAHGHTDPLVRLSPAYLALGATAVERQRHYRQCVEQPRPSLPMNWLQHAVLGTTERLGLLLAQTGVAPQPRPRGRPRKPTLVTNSPTVR